jgi:transposase-like protein
VHAEIHTLSIGGLKGGDHYDQGRPGKVAADDLQAREPNTESEAHPDKKTDHDRLGGRNEHMSRKLVPDERRAIVMAALQYDSNKSEIARRYGISRGRLYQLLNYAMTDPRGKLREAEREAEFRREVLRLSR